MNVTVGRSRVATKYGIVAASQPLAARAGVQILERGRADLQAFHFLRARLVTDCQSALAAGGR